MNTVYLSINKSNIPVLRNGIHGNRGGKNLRRLILNQDNISTININYFHGLNQLQDLDLSKNNLRNLLNGTFVGIQNLRTLVLDSNKFETLPSQNICLLKKLYLLSLNLNKLKHIKFDECYTDLKSLHSIDISGNPIEQIQPGDLDTLRKSPVSRLYLRQLKLTKLSAKVFKYLGNIKILSIKNNKIKYLEADLFKYVPGITSLSLKGNRLNKIASAALTTLISLEMLDIGRTNIKTNKLGLRVSKICEFDQIGPWLQLTL